MNFSEQQTYFDGKEKGLSMAQEEINQLKSKCAEKDAEIESLAQQIIAWRNSSKNWMTIFSERDTWRAIAKSTQKERDELKAKLETARKVLMSALDCGIKSASQNRLRIEIQEALKQIGE